MLGAEVVVSYNTNDVDITGITCNAFDTCIDLSEKGSIKLLSASGLPREGGNSVNSQENLATISLNLSQGIETVLNFTISKIINDTQKIETRNGLSLTIKTLGENEDDEEDDEEDEKDDGDVIEKKYNKCGNGIVNEKEECDNGINDGSYNTCNSDCTIAAHCGDSVTNSDISNETCDDGNSDNSDACLNSCLINENYKVTLSRIAFSLVPNTITTGSSSQAIVTATYSDGSSKNVTSPSSNPGTSYDSSNSGIANETCGTCSSIKGLSSGYATITATYTDGEITVSNSAGLTVSETRNEEPIVEPVVEEVVEPVVEEAETHPSAPTETETTIEIATTIIEQSVPITGSSIDVPTTPSDDQCMQTSSNEIDTDGDGLTDRTECYLEISPDNVDTDSDGCWDGAEINQFYTDPKNGNDCNITEKTEQYVVISDPQPGWVVSSLDISGITPRLSKNVDLVAFSSEYKELKAVIEALENLDNKNLDKLESAILKLEAFLDTYIAYEYSTLSNAVNRLKTKLADNINNETLANLCKIYQMHLLEEKLQKVFTNHQQ